MSCEGLGCNCDGHIVGFGGGPSVMGSPGVTGPVGLTDPCGPTGMPTEGLQDAPGTDSNGEHMYPGDKTTFIPVSPCAIKNEINSLVDIYYVFYRAFRWHIRYWHRDIQYGIRNIYRWFGTIWRLRAWDHGFLMEMMLKQMRYMQVDCRANVMEGEHHKALDRCVLLLDELIKRDRCDCSLLGTEECKVPKMVVCYEKQQAMLKEFGELFAQFSQSWWD